MANSKVLGTADSQSHGRYRIIINIIRGTTEGEALRLLSLGLVVSHATYAPAEEEVQRYLSAAGTVLKGVGKGLCFGVVLIINTTEGEIAFEKVLQS